MNKPLIYLDMDGVITDFSSEYERLLPLCSEQNKFLQMVTDFNVFENLKKMPNADKLLHLLFKELDVQVCILSSLGTRRTEVAKQSEEQKNFWLDNNGIVCPRKFVTSWDQKCQYGNDYSIMIDDRGDVIDSFVEKGFLGVQYIDSDWTNMEFRIRQAVSRIQQKELNDANLHL